MFKPSTVLVLPGSCNKRVDSTSAADHDGELYCKPCYGRNFGPKGYGFAGGASGLSMETAKPYEVTRELVPNQRCSDEMRFYF